MEDKYLLPSLDLIEAVFTDYENAEDARITRNLAAEIRAGRFYDPRLELIMVEDETDEVIGYCMFSRFHLEGKYEDKLLILTPVAVKTALQRQHISKELIDCGLKKAAELGYKACIVEGNPMNYRSRGFVTAAPFGITAHESIGLPAVECMMVQELVPGGLEGIHGQVCYDDYKSLH
jgi:predicted N-acetyltransferase YhbS